MTKIAISQPTYLPWLGYFEQIARSDCFVFLDIVQFERQSWQSRNRIKDQYDNIMWLSIPVVSQPLETPIQEIKIAEQKGNWQRKHLNSIKTHLAKTAYLQEVLSLIEMIYDQKYVYLADLNIAMISAVCRAMDINTTLLRASELEVIGNKTDLLLQIIQKQQATCYLANLGSKVYLENERERFTAQGIQLVYQQWQHPVYAQKGQQFISHLAWPDAIAHVGFDAARLYLSELM